MKRVLTGAALAAMLAASMGAQGGCGTAVNNKPDSGAGDNSSAKNVAHIGDTITLSGNDDGEKVAVTAVKLIRKAQPNNEFDTPDQGNHYVAVQFRLKNVGSIAFTDAPQNDATVLDASGQSYDAEILGSSRISQGQLLGSEVRITPGSRTLGYMVFQVPKGTRITKVQFSLDSGFADTAEWTTR